MTSLEITMEALVLVNYEQNPYKLDAVWCREGKTTFNVNHHHNMLNALNPVNARYDFGRGPSFLD